MTTQMTLSMAVALIAALLHYALPKSRPLSDYAWLAAALVFLLSVSGEGVSCSI